MARGLHGCRGRLTAGLLILEALVAVEILIVAAILPAVQRDLEGLQLYGWSFPALTLASFGTVPIARDQDRVPGWPPAPGQDGAKPRGD